MKQYKYTINGNVYEVIIKNVEDDVANVEVNGTLYKVNMESKEKKTTTIKRPVQKTAAPVAASTSAAAAPKPTASGAQGAVKSPLPGVILDITCNVGDEVKRGQKIAILEAMKMENNINADRDGKVVEIKVTKGQSILEGAEIIIIG